MSNRPAAILFLSLTVLATAEPGPVPRDVPPSRDGEPLPAGAVARLGSARLRHPGSIYSVAYSPDGRWIASAGTDGFARVWDASTGAQRFRFPISSDFRGQPRIAFTEAGKVLWVLPDRYPKPDLVKRYSMDSGKELPNLLPAVDRRYIGFGAGFDPAGKAFGYATYDPKLAWEVTLVDAATGERRARFAGNGEWAMEPVLAPGGSVVACPSTPARDGDGRVRLVRPDSGAEIATLDTGGPVQAMAFSPDGKLVATSSSVEKGKNKAASIWDATTGKLVRDLAGNASARSVVFSPDGKVLAAATAGGNGPVVLFDVGAGTEVRRLASHPTVTELAFSPDARRLVASRSIGTISVWDTATGEPVPPSAEPNFFFPSRFEGPDRILFDQGGPVVFDWRTGRAVERAAVPKPAQPWDRHGYVASPDRAVVAETDRTPVIRLCDSRTGAELRRLEGHAKAVTHVHFSPDGSRLYSLSHDHTRREWETATGRAGRVIDIDIGTDTILGHFELSPGGRWVAVHFATENRPFLRVWDLRTGTSPNPPTLPRGYVHHSAISPDDTTLVVAGGPRPGHVSGPGPGWLIVWDLTTRTERDRWDLPSGFSEVAFTGDGRCLIAGGFDGTVGVWERATGKERRSFRGHDGRVFRVLGSPDGRHFASAGADSLTYVWDPYAVPAGAAFDPAGAWGALASADGTKAFVAMCAMISRPTEAVAQIRKWLKPAAGLGPDRIKTLLKSLDSDRFAERERAAAELKRAGREIEPALQARLETEPSAEARERLTALLSQLPTRTADELREERAVEVLKRIGTPGAIELLTAWSRVPSLRIAHAAGRAVDRLKPSSLAGGK